MEVIEIPTGSIRQLNLQPINNVPEVIEIPVNNAKQLNLQAVHSTTNNKFYCRYFPNCNFCKNNTLQSDDPTHYCVKNCTFCSSLRKVDNIKKKEITKPIVKEIGYINNDDIYFYVTLTSSLEDGPLEYLIESMIKNFKQMFPPSRSASAYIFSINTNGVTPILYGLIRYDRLNFPSGTRISPKSNHIKNNFKSVYTGKIIKNREYNVENLTTYKNKQYLTKTDIIREKYNYPCNVICSRFPFVKPFIMETQKEILLINFNILYYMIFH